jgi:hypothetical protein
MTCFWIRGEKNGNKVQTAAKTMIEVSEDIERCCMNCMAVYVDDTGIEEVHKWIV